MYYLSTLFTVKYGTNNKTKIKNIKIKLATTIIQPTQKAKLPPTTKAMTTTTTKIRITVKAAGKIINK